MTHIIQKLFLASELFPDKKAFVFYKDFKEVESINYHSLCETVKTIAGNLANHFKPQEPVFLIYEPGIPLVKMIFGCLDARLIPIVTSPPMNKAYFNHFCSVANTANVSAIICSNDLLKTLRSFKRFSRFKNFPFAGQFFRRNTGYEIKNIPGLNQKLFSDTDLNIKGNDVYVRSEFDTNELAFLQFSSGTTESPKGVMVSHQNLSTNLELIAKESGSFHDPNPIILGWVPPYHDMGLVGMIFFNPYVAGTLHFFSPMDFIASPLNWLKLISETKSAYSMAPNFAYEICARYAENYPRLVKELKLNSLKVLLNGSEPVSAVTFNKFIEVFTPYGLQPQVLRSCYGMAETTLFISSTNKETNPKIIHLDRDKLINHEIEIKDTPDSSTAAYISCGTPCEEVLIMNPSTLEPALPNEIGEIWITGPSVAQGYWKSPEETEEAFVTLSNGKRYVRTGDLGFFYKNQIYVCGRMKDLIIVGGKNYHPHEIEATVEKSCSLVRINRVIAFSVLINGREQAAVAFEAKKKLNEKSFVEVVNTIRGEVIAEQGISISKVYLVAKGEIPKTTTGKLRRNLLQQQILKNRIRIIHSWELNEPESVKVDHKKESPALSNEKIRAIILNSIQHLTGSIEDNDEIWNQPFEAFGIDSLTLMEMFQRISAELGEYYHVSSVDFFNCKNLNEVLHVIFNNEKKAKNKEQSYNSTFTKDILDNCLPKGNFEQIQNKEHIGYYVYPRLEGEISNRMFFRGKEMIVWSINNYLAIASDPRLSEAVSLANEKYGPTFPMASRLLSGESEAAVQLEQNLAKFVKKEDAMLAVYGYLGVMGVIDTVTSNEDYIVIDQQSHACMIDGAKLATYGNNHLRSFKTNDVEDLERVLKSIRKESNKGILVVCEGVYGMSGSISPLKEFCELKNKYHARIFLDDSHGFGVLGANGRGAGEECGVHHDIDLYYTTAAKSLASIGGFIAGPQYVINYLRFNTRTTIFTRSLPLINIIAIQKALDILISEPERREKLHYIKKRLQTGLTDAGFTLVSTDSPITAILFPDQPPEVIMTFIRELREKYNIFASGVAFPVVPKEQARIRLVPTAAHTEEDVDRTIEAFINIKKQSLGGLNVKIYS